MNLNITDFGVIHFNLLTFNYLKFQSGTKSFSSLLFQVNFWHLFLFALVFVLLASEEQHLHLRSHFLLHVSFPENFDLNCFNYLVLCSLIADGVFFLAANRVDNRFVQGMVGTYEQQIGYAFYLHLLGTLAWLLAFLCALVTTYKFFTSGGRS